MSTDKPRSAPTISTAPPEHLALDFEALRLEGIHQLERLAGGVWTDFNAHDPGITILEQACYAITDLAYRISYDLPDLLARAGEPASADLFTPAEILPSAPVTLADLRKVVIDVDGVHNAWVEVVEETRPPLYYHEGRRELSLRADDETAEIVHLRGLYRVLIEKSEVSWRGGASVVEAVTRRLHACRGLCEDFAEIVVLEPQDLRVHAELEIDALEDPAALLLAVYRALADELSPTVRFASLGERLAAGAPVDAIFEGPLLDHGFVDDEALGRGERRLEIHTSDLIRVIMATPGVRAVRRIALALASGPRERWTVRVGDGQAPRLVLGELGGDPSRPALTIGLRRDGVAIAVDEAAVVDGYRAWLLSRVKRAPLSAEARDLRPTPGRDRQVSRYTSIQRDFPATYGIGEIGLPASASPGRRAAAQQLRAYLTFFDQILANCFAQLGHARTLLAFDDDRRAYAAQAIEDPAIGAAEIWRGPPPSAAELAAMIDAGVADEALGERRHRFLNHLLARFSEQLTDYSLLLYGAVRGGAGGQDAAAVRARLAEDKAGFLREYPRISGARGTAQNLLEPPGPNNRSGLGDRLRRKLGLRDADDEGFRVIEHILLRPIDDDRRQAGDDDDERLPLLAATETHDPYSLRLSVVFPDWPLRLRDPGFRQFVEETVREEVPAHLRVHVRWVDAAGWASISAAHDRWLEVRRARLTI